MDDEDYEDCDACAGSGEQECPDCDGDGCVECDGTGEVECNVCDGEGGFPS